MYLTLLPASVLATEAADHTCTDNDSDYWCDDCWEGIPHDHIDEDEFPHYCNLCGEHLRELCVGENGGSVQHFSGQWDSDDDGIDDADYVYDAIVDAEGNWATSVIIEPLGYYVIFNDFGRRALVIPSQSLNKSYCFRCHYYPCTERCAAGKFLPEPQVKYQHTIKYPVAA